MMKFLTNFIFLISVIRTTQDPWINNIVQQTIVECNYPNYVIDVTNESIHSLIITPKHILVKFIEDRKLKDMELLKFQGRNETLKKLSEILINYKTEKTFKTLIICGPENSSLGAKELKVVFKNMYKQIIIGFAMFNGPKKYLENNSIGLICESQLSIQYHKYEGDNLEIFMRNVKEGDFVHELVCKYLVRDPRVSIATERFASKILDCMSVYKFILEHLHHFKPNKWKMGSLIKIIKNSILFTNEDWLDRSILVYEDRCAIKEKDAILFAMIKEGDWNILMNFISSLDQVTDSLLHTISFIYEMVRNDEDAFTFCLLDILSNKSQFHYNLLIYISYLLGLIGRKEVAYFIERNMPSNPSFIEAGSAINLVNKIIAHSFKRNCTLSYFFQLLITDLVCRRVVEGNEILMAKYGCLRFIKKLSESMPVINEDNKNNMKETKYNRVFTLFYRLFHSKEVLEDVKENVLYNVLYAINRYILENDEFDFYSTNDIICTLGDELKLKKNFTN